MSSISSINKDYDQLFRRCVPYELKPLARLCSDVRLLFETYNSKISRHSAGSHKLLEKMVLCDLTALMKESVKECECCTDQDNSHGRPKLCEECTTLDGLYGTLDARNAILGKAHYFTDVFFETVLLAVIHFGKEVFMATSLVSHIKKLLHHTTINDTLVFIPSRLDDNHSLMLALADFNHDAFKKYPAIRFYLKQVLLDWHFFAEFSQLARHNFQMDDRLNEIADMGLDSLFKRVSLFLDVYDTPTTTKEDPKSAQAKLNVQELQGLCNSIKRMNQSQARVRFFKALRVLESYARLQDRFRPIPSLLKLMIHLLCITSEAFLDRFDVYVQLLGIERKKSLSLLADSNTFYLDAADYMELFEAMQALQTSLSSDEFELIPTITQYLVSYFLAMAEVAIPANTQFNGDGLTVGVGIHHFDEAEWNPASNPREFLTKFAEREDFNGKDFRVLANQIITPLVEGDMFSERAGGILRHDARWVDMDYVDGSQCTILSATRQINLVTFGGRRYSTSLMFEFDPWSFQIIRSSPASCHPLSVPFHFWLNENDARSIPVSSAHHILRFLQVIEDKIIKFSPIMKDGIPSWLVKAPKALWVEQAEFSGSLSPDMLEVKDLVNNFLTDLKLLRSDFVFDVVRAQSRLLLPKIYYNVLKDVSYNRKDLVPLQFSVLNWVKKRTDEQTQAIVNTFCIMRELSDRLNFVMLQRMLSFSANVSRGIMIGILNAGMVR